MTLTLLSFGALLKLLWTGLAGALGAGARHTISTHSRTRFGDAYPWGTLAINLSGALLIGLLTALTSHVASVAPWHTPLALGFLGGYTTFSTFMLETSRLRRAGSHGRLLSYLLGSMLLGPLAAFAGLWIGQAWA